MTDIKTSVLYVCGKPAMVTLDYLITLEPNKSKNDPENSSEFRLSYYPHKLSVFRDMLDEIFTASIKHRIYGDFKPLDDVEHPGFYVHVMETRV